MGFENKYPYTDFHELNLDWILEKVKQVSTEWPEFETSMENAWQQYKDALTGPNGEWPTFKTEINTSFEDFTKQIIHEFDGYTAYTTGDYTYYQKKIYKCEVGSLLPFPRQFTDYTWTAVGDYDGLVKDLLGYLRQNINGMQSSITNWIKANAYLYSSANTYKKGDICLHDDITGLVYFQAKQDIDVPENWNSSHWDKVKLANALLTEIRDNYQSMIDAYADFLDTYQRTWGIVQTTGTSTNDAMSQKAVTDELDAIDSTLNTIDGDIDTINNTLDDIETGNEIVGHAAVADNLTPYSEDSGTTQEEPFISQGTGTDNNSVIVTTGTIARQLEKQGNTVVKNQQVRNPNFANGTSNWNANGRGTLAVSDGVASYTITAITGSDAESHRIEQFIPVIAGHKYLFTMLIKSPKSCKANVSSYSSGIGISTTDISANTWTKYYRIGTVTIGGNNVFCFSFDGYDTTHGFEIGDIVQYKDCYGIDLTQWFNGDANIPQDLLDNPSHFSWYYNGSLAFDAGSLQNCNGRYLECGQGRQLWDEELVVGSLLEDGTIETADTHRRTTTFIPIVPNKPFYQQCPYSASNGRVAYYDANKNLVKFDINGLAANTYYTAPANAFFMRVCLGSAYGTTYNHDITYSLYYTPEEGGEGYNQHYDYVAPIRIDTGNETLLAFDKKLPSGVIERGTVNPTLTELEWTYSSGANKFYAPLTGIENVTSLQVGHILCNRYTPTSAENLNNDAYDMCIAILNGNEIQIKNLACDEVSELVTALAGVTAQIKASTETTEQGTSFSEYADINDYSYMAWFDTDGNLVSIPQGCKLFYPVDYKGFIDDGVMYTNGDFTSLAKLKDITDLALQARGYLKLTALTGYDATKTQTLKNVQGVFTWVDDQ